jgi:regulator of protease activity HflC (stomatin/prohibitin superfamily)
MSREIEVVPKSGWGMLAVNILLYAFAVYLFYRGIVILDSGQSDTKGVWTILAAVLTVLCSVLVSIGFFVLQPNEAGVLVLFGSYSGSVKRNGFWWANPFLTKKKISLRLRNLNGQKLKVNDHAGNPIEIAAVVMWYVEDTFAATFEVDDYVDYVTTQSETALRHLASIYPYDSWEENAPSAISLRGSIDEVSVALVKELQERLYKAGVKVQTAQLSHLAYAQEIAEAMLKRQQASAIVAARTKIVDGAVGMVQMALERLSAEHVVELDEERKASMVSNLLVVLCGEKEAHPVINAGTLYS